jgi:hypothetical protein
MSAFYDKQGRPLTTAEAEPLLCDMEYKRIGLTEERGYRVSTVWLGIDHNFTSQGGPRILFETMIFGPDSWEGEYCERYATEDAARAGHDRAVMVLRTEIIPAATP